MLTRMAYATCSSSLIPCRCAGMVPGALPSPSRAFGGGVLTSRGRLLAEAPLLRGEGLRRLLARDTVAEEAVAAEAPMLAPLPAALGVGVLKRSRRLARMAAASPGPAGGRGCRGGVAREEEPLLPGHEL